MRRAAVLWTLLGLFALRVAGQFAVATGRAPFLPPMEQWQSGLLPYGVLLFSQVVILATFVRICRDFSRGRGFFVRPHAWLGRPLWVFGWLYAGSMGIRYAVWMAMRPDQRWMGGSIPIVFHIVLAAFLLTLADHHRQGRIVSGPDH